ncbi:MAG: 4Fe-4S binding protein [Flavonifractor plautii]
MRSPPPSTASRGPCISCGQCSAVCPTGAITVLTRSARGGGPSTTRSRVQIAPQSGGRGRGLGLPPAQCLDNWSPP